MEPRYYGLILEPLKPEDHVFGASPFAGEPLRPDGNWTDFLPPYEHQFKGPVDSMSCTSFGTLNAVEMLLHRTQTLNANYSDRFLAKVSGTTPLGNTPNKVADAIRNKGLVLETDWPFEGKTWAEYMAEIPRKLFTLAAAFIAEYDFRYKYVPSNPAVMKEALKYSPLGVSVAAWFKNSDGLFYKPEGMRDNHWTVIYGYEDGKYWKCYDSYNVAGEGESVVKHLAWDTPFEWVYSYSITRQVASESMFKRFLEWIQAIVYGAPEPEPLPLPTIPPSPPTQVSNREKLHQEALYWVGKDASPKNLAEKDVSCAEGASTIIGRVFPQFKGIPQDELGGAIYLSTRDLDNALAKSPYFKATKIPKPGCVISSPRTRFINGHVGFITEDNRIISNESKTGLMQNNYSLTSWIREMKDRRELAVNIYEPL